MEILRYPENKDRIKEIAKKRADFIDEDKLKSVQEIVNRVKVRGDEALFEYTRKFDRVNLKKLRVSEKEIEEAYQSVDKGFLQDLKQAINNIGDYHRKQLKESWFSHDRKGNIMGQLINPVQRVGAYVPGGRAPYPSSVIMTVIPARVAGVDEVVVVTPPDKEGKVNSYTLVATREAGADEIYRVGGAQAVAALTYGTESIKPVEKIVGPGNIYVTLAKKMVSGIVGIDMLAGPSEIMILADETAEPEYIAADLLSQAEHDPLAAPVFVTPDWKLVEEVISHLENQMKDQPRRETMAKSWENQGLIIIVEDIKTGLEMVNLFGPEHFELMVEDPFKYLPDIKNAGAIFLGKYSPEPLGDYVAGPNHVLPTGGTARFSSPLSVDDFIKKSSLIFYSREGFNEVAGGAISLAQKEGFNGHASSVSIRLGR
ncbi:histidinol dehydrogenase [Halothermothrix orenii]|uniref:Histidinol dehydrogenase n=1 Tax=Halothermothrix orenii (strain H 168 / OCM 544 / DSM 9562) TaxID=373903 RepID=B8D112_HALOH|nr:histidinol dehydrogenase [Halothermothrix orenii]ACL68981.1 Histidinol dehydrogenase [Halothermothrix orenii H 168]